MKIRFVVVPTGVNLAVRVGDTRDVQESIAAEYVRLGWAEPAEDAPVTPEPAAGAKVPREGATPAGVGVDLDAVARGATEGRALDGPPEDRAVKGPPKKK
jgi:hypothetical protein